MPITVGMGRLGLGLALLLVALAALPAAALSTPGAPVHLDGGGSFTAAELSTFPGGGTFPRDHEKKDREGSERNVEKPKPRRTNPRSPRTADGGVARSAAPALSLQSPLGFDGPSLDDAPAYPPDTQGDVGPTQFITMVNRRIISFNKTTGVADGVLNATTNTLRSAPPSTICSATCSRVVRFLAGSPSFVSKTQ